MARAVAGAERYGEPVAVCVLDLDQFRLVNDTHGYEAGDRLLASAAAALQGRLRATDALGRIGADEFAVVLPETDAAGAAVVAERVAADPLAKGRITASYGIAGFAAGPAEDLLRAAELALGAAKRARKAPRLSVA